MVHGEPDIWVVLGIKWILVAFAVLWHFSQEHRFVNPCFFFACTTFQHILFVSLMKFKWSFLSSVAFFLKVSSFWKLKVALWRHIVWYPQVKLLPSVSRLQLCVFCIDRKHPVWPRLGAIRLQTRVSFSWETNVRPPNTSGLSAEWRTR